MQGWFSKEKKQTDKPVNAKENTDSLEDFQDVLEKSLKEEKTQILDDKKQQNKNITMVKTLIDNGYTIQEINDLIHAKKTYELRDGKVFQK